jgi:hypothetical protein
VRRKYQISADNRFYKQEYCGCIYSLRDSNIYRKNAGIPAVKIGGSEAGLGTRHFEDPEADAEEENQDVVDDFFREAEQSFRNERIRKGRGNASEDTAERIQAVYAGRKKNCSDCKCKQGGNDGQSCAGPGTTRTGKGVELSEINNW